MDAGNPMTPPNQQKREDRRRKRKAILAGGVVLGLGAAVTLAAWSDDVFANGIFDTGTFEMQGNTTNDVSPASEGWSDYDGPSATTPSSGTLTFDQSPQVLVPGVQLRAPLALRLDDATTLDASRVLLSGLTITSGTNHTTALDQKLTYHVYSGINAATCTGTTAPTGATITGLVNTTATNSTSLGTLTAKNGTTAQTVLPLCLGITLNQANDRDEAVQGLTDITLQWQFTGETAR